MLMKKICIAIAAVLFVAASVATVFAVRSHNRMGDFFRANVDALTNVEDNKYDQKIWEVYKRKDGINCTPGGDEACL